MNDKRKLKWDNGETNPYDVLRDPIELERKGFDLVVKGNTYFSKKIQIDWGSFAWRCTEKQIVKYLKDHKTQLPWLLGKDEEMIEEVLRYVEREKGEAYGIVCIENY